MVVTEINNPMAELNWKDIQTYKNIDNYMPISGIFDFIADYFYMELSQ